ncbi:hypothetical protein VNO77_14323 [Canavalia gladiata]|uniref:Uncharacterized protein n=1 Tax=Canavalia gladiata TaxID=3824 RepID=A0AAN9QNN6_CANGL
MMSVLSIIFLQKIQDRFVLTNCEAKASIRCGRLKHIVVDGVLRKNEFSKDRTWDLGVVGQRANPLSWAPNLILILTTKLVLTLHFIESDSGLCANSGVDSSCNNYRSRLHSQISSMITQTMFSILISLVKTGPKPGELICKICRLVRTG